MDAAAAQAAGAAAPRVERLNSEVQNQLNLEGMRARAVGLYKAISRILEDFDAIARANPNASPKWYAPQIPPLPSIAAAERHPRVSLAGSPLLVCAIGC
jgi:hypothetical protein